MSQLSEDKYRSLRIVFMGTPDFAVASLAELLGAGCNIAAVVTAPDKPSGRGLKLNEPAVKSFASSRGLKVLQPEKLRSPEFIEELRALKADLQIVVAFRMLPEMVWNMPPLGTVNLHASLLPKYRGAAPINHAIINGEQETGVTTFFLRQEIDTGDMLLSKTVTIGDEETAGELHDRLMEAGAALLVDTVKAISSGDYSGTPQSPAENGELPKAPKLFREDCQVNWNQPARQVFNRIRGLSPYPTAFTLLDGKLLKIFRAELKLKEPGIQPGGFLTDGKTHLDFACSDGFLSLKEVQLEGKKKMGIEDFLRGTKLG